MLEWPLGQNVAKLGLFQPCNQQDRNHRTQELKYAFITSCDVHILYVSVRQVSSPLYNSPVHQGCKSAWLSCGSGHNATSLFKPSTPGSEHLLVHVDSLLVETVSLMFGDTNVFLRRGCAKSTGQEWWAAWFGACICWCVWARFP